MQPDIQLWAKLNEAKKGMVRLRVKELAQARGIGLAKLSRLADVHYKTVQTIWRDPYHGVNTKTLERIAKALNVPMSELFEDVPDED